MKYRIIVYPPKSKSLIEVIVTANDNKKEYPVIPGVFEFDMHLPWKYNKNGESEYFDVKIVYTTKKSGKITITYPVPELL